MTLLRENTLFGPVDPVQTAIDRLREFEPQALAMRPGGYWLAFSGGKDSMVIYDLAKRAGVAFQAYMNLTTVDPPELLRYVRKEYPRVTMLPALKTMRQLIIDKGIPPTQLMRFCCENLKEAHGEGMVVTGVRWAESRRRKRFGLTGTCMANKRKHYLRPIIDWSDAEVWRYIKGRGLPYCSLYDEGRTRIGCVGCPCANKKRRDDFKRWPRFERYYRRACDAAATKPLSRWRSGEAMFNWWMQYDEAGEDGLFT